MSRMLMRGWMAAGLIAVAAGAAEAQQAHFGPRVGYNFDVDEALLGVQLLLPLTRAVEVYPSFDYYFVDAGTLFAFNGDLKFRLGRRRPSVFYLGGGLNVLVRKNGVDDTDAGANIFGGLEARRGSVHPFVEARLLLHDDSSLQVLFGLNFTLY